jgi:hypothetical protein
MKYSEKLEQLDFEEREEFFILATFVITHGENHGKNWQATLSSGKFAKLLTEKKHELVDFAESTADRRLKKFQSLELIERVSRGAGRSSASTIILKDYAYQGSLLTGVVPLDSPLYITRKADRSYSNIFHSYHDTNESIPFVRIKGAKGMGKTSLLIRIRDFLERDRNHVVAFVDLNSDAFDLETLQNLETLFYRFTEEVTQEFLKAVKELNPPSLQMFWRKERSSGKNCTGYLEEHIFKKIKKPKTLLIDGLDRIFGRAVQTDFLKVLRSWNERKMKTVSKAPLVWPSVAIAYSTEPYPDPKIPDSPLQNVGTLLELQEFPPNSILDLSKIYGLNWDMSTITSLIKLIGGYPPLVHQALYKISQDNINLTDLENQATQVNGVFRYQLLRLEKLLDENEEILWGLKQILEGKKLPQSLAYKIQQMGLIREDEKGMRISCLLYENFLYKNYFPTTKSEE